MTREYRRTVTTGKEGASDYANTGIEGYGWGALSIHLLMRYVLGLYEEEAGTIKIAPVLPLELRKAGATYSAGPVAWGKYTLHVACTVKDSDCYSMHVHCTRPIQSPSGVEIFQEPEINLNTVEQEWAWESSWGEERILQLP